MKKIICPVCKEIIGYNKTGELGGQEPIFCKNRPHIHSERTWKNE